MMQMTVMWGGECIVVVVRPAEHSGTNELRNAIREAAFKHGLSDTFYKWMLMPSSDGTFYAWNISHPDLFREMLRRRKEGDIYFRVYYRPCGGVSTVMPEGDYFREI